MLLVRAAMLLAVLGFVVYCVLDVVRTPSAAVRNLPKPLWLALVLLMPLVCGVAWLLAGRPRAAGGPVAGAPGPRHAGPPTDSRPHPSVRRPVAPAPDDDEAFLHALRARAEQQRARERARREDEQRDQDGPGDPPDDERPTGR